MSLHSRSKTTAPKGRGWFYRRTETATLALVLASAVVADNPPPSPPTVSATYQLSGPDGSQEFVLIRRPDRIEYRFATGERQLWLRGKDGITLIRMFDNDQRSVEYTPGDLAALDATPDWDALMQLIPKSSRDSLLKYGTGQWQSHSGKEFRAPENDRHQRLLWSEALQLPLWWELGQTRWSLSQIRMQADDADYSSLTRYPILEYADIGDQEKDPFARTLIHFGDGHAHPRSSH